MAIMMFFIHNTICSMTSEAKNRKNIPRDIKIAFFLVYMSYTIVGAIGYASYRSLGDCFPPNFLNEPVYSDTFVPAIIARFALLIQLLTVLTLLLFVIRVQFFGYLFKTQFPTFLQATLVNMSLLSLATAVSIFFPDGVATVIRFTGAFGGYCYVFCLPVLVHCKSKKRQNQLTTQDVVLAVGVISFGTFLLGSQFVPQSSTECVE